MNQPENNQSPDAGKIACPNCGEAEEHERQAKGFISLDGTLFKCGSSIAAPHLPIEETELCQTRRELREEVAKCVQISSQLVVAIQERDQLRKERDDCKRAAIKAGEASEYWTGQAAEFNAKLIEWRKVAEELARALDRIIPDAICHNAHHEKKDQHSGIEACPVQGMAKEALADFERLKGGK